MAEVTGDRSFKEALSTLERYAPKGTDLVEVSKRWLTVVRATGGPGDGWPVDHDAAAFLIARVLHHDAPLVLEVGCGTGYSGGCMAMAAEIRGGVVVSFDSDPKFEEIARANLARMPWASLIEVVHIDPTKPEDYQVHMGAVPDIVFIDSDDWCRSQVYSAVGAAGFIQPETEVYLHDAHRAQEGAILAGIRQEFPGVETGLVLVEGRGVAMIRHEHGFKSGKHALEFVADTKIVCPDCGGTGFVGGIYSGAPNCTRCGTTGVIADVIADEPKSDEPKRRKASK